MVDFLDKLEKLKRQKYLNSEEWQDHRNEVLLSSSNPAHCYTCGRPFRINPKTKKYAFTTHHLRYPRPKEPFNAKRDCACICGKCHYIIGQHPEMQDPGLSKRRLRRLLQAYFRDGIEQTVL